MQKPSVLITRLIPAKAIEYLKEQCDVEVNRHDRPMTQEELFSAAKGKDALMTMLNDPVNAELMDIIGSQCKVIANYAVGYNNMDVAAATERGIFLTNTPDVLTDATADMAWALMLAVARRVVEGDHAVRNGEFTGWSPLYMLGPEVTGKTLGIIGAGRIGQATARRAAGFNMKVIYTARTPKTEFEAATGASYVSLDDLLKSADFISIHVPLTAQTHHLIGQRELRLMKKSAVIINTARGPVIDEKALAEALREDLIWGAGLDVYEREPQVTEELLSLSNVVLTPHLGSSTFETREKMGLMAADNILKAIHGEVPPQCLNPEAAGKRR
jgi:D-3-phosphoglycerate dehydrogenase